MLIKLNYAALYQNNGVLTAKQERCHGPAGPMQMVFDSALWV